MTYISNILSLFIIKLVYVYWDKEHWASAEIICFLLDKNTDSHQKFSCSYWIKYIDQTYINQVEKYSWENV